MCTILIAEDEAIYRDLLVHSLARQGYVTHVAATGHEAIALGARLRPRLLIADWLLLNHIHGLHVAAALRAVDPQLHTILITGFDAKDLRTQAAQLPGCQYLAKPFRLRSLLQEVSSAMRDALLPPDALPIAVAEIDTAGAICYANAAARALFATTVAGTAARHLADIVHLDALATLDDTPPWREVVAHTPGPDIEHWWLGVRTDPGVATRLLVLAHEEDDYTLYDSAARLLLNIPPPPEMRWPCSGRVLIVDPDPVTRRLARNQIELTDAVCHTVGTLEEGLRLFQQNPAICTVILADDTLSPREETLAAFVAQLRARQPPVSLVGTSHENRRAAFATLGVSAFLRKPWRAEALIALLAAEATHQRSRERGA